MNNRKWLYLAGIVAGAASVGMLAIAAPKEVWTNDSVVAAAILFLSFASPPFLVASMQEVTATDAPFIWLIGPLGRFWLLLLVVAGIDVGMSFYGWHRASWATSLAWLGICFIGFAMLKASTQIVAVAAEQTRPSSMDARSKWIAMMKTLQLQADSNEVRKSIEGIAEKVQFAANDSTAPEPNENQELDAILGQLEFNLAKPDEIARLIRSAEVLLLKREQSLRAGRTRA